MISQSSAIFEALYITGVYPSLGGYKNILTQWKLLAFISGISSSDLINAYVYMIHSKKFKSFCAIEMI